MSLSVAVVGASPDRRKFGNKAVRAHLAKGHTVWPVHPSAAAVEGLPCLRSLRDLPGPVDRVSFYVPPAVGVTLLPDVAALPGAELWLNPGAESEELLRAAEALGLRPILACSILALGMRPAELPDR